MWKPDWGIAHAFFDPWRCLGLMLSSGVECQLRKSVEVFVSSLHPLWFPVVCPDFPVRTEFLQVLFSLPPSPCLLGKLIVNYSILNAFPISHILEETEHCHQALLTVSWEDNMSIYVRTLFFSCSCGFTHLYSPPLGCNLREAGNSHIQCVFLEPCTGLGSQEVLTGSINCYF